MHEPVQEAPFPMSIRLSLIYGSIAALGLVAALALGSSVRSRAAVSPGMTGYIMDGDLLSGLAFADGTEVGSTDFPYPVVPPGSYTITIDDTAASLGFTLSGIGVSQTTGVPDRGTVIWSVTLLPCVLYAYNGGHRFQTSQSPASTAACPQLDTQVSATTPTTVPTRPTQTISAGSAGGGGLSAAGTPLPAAVAKGVLEVRLSSGGRLELRLGDKPVSRLRPGLYEIDAVDRAHGLGLELERSGGRPLAVTSAAFVGTRRIRARLGAGTWTASVVPAGSGSLARFSVSAS